jgi:hypothetical protein
MISRYDQPKVQGIKTHLSIAKASTKALALLAREGL